MNDLTQYHKRRDFSRTDEPSEAVKPHPGTGTRHPALGYVIQKHAARRLHYDFRLELDGVLLSWAIPKGPCLDPTIKRLAVLVEPHPIAYGDFEGQIAEGQYGAGTVMVWDTGTWQPDDEAPAAAFAKGHLSFTLDGNKLKGSWHLVRTRRGNSDAHWLLFKDRDEYAEPGENTILEREPNSALSGRSIEQIARKETSKAKRRTTEIDHVPAPPRNPKEQALPRSAATLDTSAVRLTHPDKVLYPESALTKRDLLEYVALIAKAMLPHVVNRPLTLVRCPNGTEKPCFFQKHPHDARVPGLRSVAIREKAGKADYTTLDDEQGLFALVQLSVLEIHTCGSLADNFEHPNILVFDLDPDPSVGFSAVMDCARRLREVFQTAHLESFVKTTGGKGLHVCVPVEPSLSWDEAKSFTQRIAQALVTESPERYVATQSKAQRKGKIFIDYLRNGRGATFVAPYSMRARPGAPVATPLFWDELTVDLKPDQFTVENMAQRLAKLKEDPFARMAMLKQALPGGASTK